MATDTTVNNLIINKLTKAQYDAIASPSDTELYLVPDEVDSTPTSGSDNPVASGGVYTALAGKADASSLATVATSGSYNDLSNKPTIPDITGKADKSDAIGTLTLSLDSTNYKVTLSGTKVDGTSFTVQSVIDLPLESVVVGGSYDDTTKKVVLTLQSGSTVEFSVADLVAGLQSEITSTNKLSADLISDGTTNKTVTQTEKNTWNGKGTYSKPSGGIPKTDLASTVQTSLGLADTALQSFTETDPVFSASDAAGITSADIASWNAKVSNVQSDWNASSGAAQILNKPTIPDDSTLVHTSGDEIIQGNKWFANLKTTYGGSVSIMGTMTIDDIGGSGKIVLTGDDYTWSQIQSGNTTLQQALDAKVNTASLATVATSGSYNDLSNKPTIPTVPTNVSAFTNDAGYLIAHQDISGKESTSNKVTSLSSSSTDTQYPSAKCVYDIVGDIQTALTAILS